MNKQIERVVNLVNAIGAIKALNSELIKKGEGGEFMACLQSHYEKPVFSVFHIIDVEDVVLFEVNGNGLIVVSSEDFTGDILEATKFLAESLGLDL